MQQGLQVRSQILAVLGRNTMALAGEVRHFPAGWAVRTPALPAVWTLNQVHLCEPVAFEEAVALSEEHQGDLPYRHLVVEDATTLAGAQQPMAAGRWSAERQVLMALEAEPDRRVGTSAVEEIDEEEMLSLMARWLSEELPSMAADELGQLVEYHRREGRRWQEQRFGVREQGVAVAVTKLRIDGPTAWVEDVYTLPEARGHGSARRLVGHAADVARANRPELAFIVADDNDWPKQLYERLGFRACGTTHTLHRSLA